MNYSHGLYSPTPPRAGSFVGCGSVVTQLQESSLIRCCDGSTNWDAPPPAQAGGGGLAGFVSQILDTVDAREIFRQLVNRQDLWASRRQGH